jgi:hypothetical protein
MWENNTSAIGVENGSKTRSNSSILRSSEYVLSVKDVTIDAGDTAKDKTGISQRMYNSTLKYFIPFITRKKNDAEIEVYVSTDQSDARRNYKCLVLKKGAKSPLFENQNFYAEKFEELCLENEKERTKLVNNLENAMETYEDLKICFLVDHAKDEGEVAFKITISFFSWIMEALKLSFFDVEMFAASIAQKSGTWHDYGNLCAFAFEDTVDTKYFLKSNNKSENEKDSQMYHVVFHLKNFSELEVSFI